MVSIVGCFIESSCYLRSNKCNEKDVTQGWSNLQVFTDLTWFAGLGHLHSILVLYAYLLHVINL